MSVNYSYKIDLSNNPVAIIISIAICILLIVALWKVFEKAGREGWKSIIPFYNFFVELNIIGLPWWYFIFLFIPIVRIYAIFRINFELAKSYGKSIWYGVGLVFLYPIFISILAFDSSVKYVGNTAAPSTNNADNSGVNQNVVLPTDNLSTQPVDQNNINQ